MELKHPALMKSSGWKWVSRLRDLNAAQEWGCNSPKEFDALLKDERLDIIAWYEVQWRVQSINNYEQQQEMIRNAKPRRRK